MTPTYFYGFSDTLLEVVLHEPPGGRVPEALVQDIWLNQRLDTRDLRTVDGTHLVVVDPGQLNTDAGPDFLGARLRIGQTMWSGSVEIHVKSGTWIEHGHDADPRYDSTLLHVALYHDMWTGQLHRSDGSALPELVLLPYLEQSIRRLIRSFYVRTDERILCAGGWGRVSDGKRTAYIRNLAVERILSKARRYGGRDPEQALYEGVLAGLGYSKNAGAMQTLARVVPLTICRELESDGDSEALLLGASGLLPGPSDLLEADRETADYVMELRDRFERLNHRFEIDPMPSTAWRFFRLRPANFPSLRIAQGAALVRPRGLLCNEPLQILAQAARARRPIPTLRGTFAAALPSFWNEHVRLHKKTRPRRPEIGRQRVDAVIANVVVPALVARAQQIGYDPEPYFSILDDLPPSDDEITRLFAGLGTRPATAGEVQGLHQLFRTRCSEARCLSCRIGREVLRME